MFRVPGVENNWKIRSSLAANKQDVIFVIRLLEPRFPYHKLSIASTFGSNREVFEPELL